MLGLKLIHVSKRGPMHIYIIHICIHIVLMSMFMNSIYLDSINLSNVGAAHMKYLKLVTKQKHSMCLFEFFGVRSG